MTTSRIVPMIIVTAALASCGALKERTDAVVVTAIAKDVEHCQRIGRVATDSPELDKDDGLNQLRTATARRNGNAVLVDSYATSRDGFAYACDPPLKADSGSGKPQ